MTALEAADCLRAAAVAPPPAPLPNWRTLADWIGEAAFHYAYIYFCVYVSSDADEFFFQLTSDDQRTFLLILAELIEV